VAAGVAGVDSPFTPAATAVVHACGGEYADTNRPPPPLSMHVGPWCREHLAMPRTDFAL
jgi:hypothetical protein